MPPPTAPSPAPAPAPAPTAASPARDMVATATAVEQILRAAGWPLVPGTYIAFAREWLTLMETAAIATSATAGGVVERVSKT